MKLVNSTFHGLPLMMSCVASSRVSVPDDLDQLAHVDVVGYQELGLVQNRQLLLSLVPFNDHLQPQTQTGQFCDFQRFGQKQVCL